MKTLKISLVATLASFVAWWMHLPMKVWPEHPLLADTLLAFVVCVVLQFVWADSKTEKKPETKEEGP